MAANILQHNGSKTEAILVGTPHETRSSTITSISFSGHDIHHSSLVTNFSVRMDRHLTFETHIQHLCKTSSFHLRNIAKLRPILTLPDSEKLVHAFVSSRLDYCNTLLIRIPSKNIQRLQYIQNCAARILMGVRKYRHITPILNPSTGFLSSTGLNSRFSCCPTSASMALPPYTSKNSSPPIPPHAISALDRPTSSSFRGQRSELWAIAPSAQLHPLCDCGFF
ncbi:uncharacterized protein LOC130380685 [Gadus chalcogrammus]|uniref:uncharacterized protein LOC130380685 n=1 Tax=Gadus chalcogrammus TaxID=1042646 RepID=UPI0024C36AC2|nr:uncharacterized protein LOC130380685 [Gadus chalcogrammus]